MKNILRTWLAILGGIFFFTIGTATSPEEDWAVLALNINAWENDEKLYIVNLDTFNYVDASIELDTDPENQYCYTFSTIAKGDTFIIDYATAELTCHDTISPFSGEVSALEVRLYLTPEPSLEGHFYKEF